MLYSREFCARLLRTPSLRVLLYVKKLVGKKSYAQRKLAILGVSALSTYLQRAVVEMVD